MDVQYNQDRGVNFSAEAIRRSAIDLGGKALTTLYHLEAFAPWKVSEIAYLLRHHKMRVTAQRMQKLLGMAAECKGDLYIPITGILQAIPRLPQQIVDILYAQPIWVDGFYNLVVTAGLNDSLDKHLKGSSYTAAWYVGLTAGSPTVAAGDTMGSHGGWTEVTAYDESVRQTLTLGSVSGGSVDNSASKAVFTVSTNSTTIGGAFVTSNSTKGGTTGTLYGGGALSAGNKTLDDNDVLNVTITATATAS